MDFYVKTYFIDLRIAHFGFLVSSVGLTQEIIQDFARSRVRFLIF